MKKLLKKYILTVALFTSINASAFDPFGGGGSLSDILDVLKDQLNQLEQLAKAVGDASKITAADAVEVVLDELDLKPPAQIVELWKTADGLRALAETADGLYSQVESSFKLWDGSVLERSVSDYKPIDAVQQAVRRSIELSTKNERAKTALQVQRDLIQKAALAAPVTEVLRLSVLASGLEARMLRLSIEELAAQQKVMLQMAANQAAKEAREQAEREEDEAHLAAVPALLNKVFPVFQALK